MNERQFQAALDEIEEARLFPIRTGQPPALDFEPLRPATEDLSVVIARRDGGGRLYVIDTRGGFDVVDGLQAYQDNRTEALSEHSSYEAAVADAKARLFAGLDARDRQAAAVASGVTFAEDDGNPDDDPTARDVYGRPYGKDGRPV